MFPLFIQGYLRHPFPDRVPQTAPGAHPLPFLMIGIFAVFLIPVCRNHEKQGGLLQNVAKSVPWGGTGQTRIRG
jgi:hypothetical protein